MIYCLTGKIVKKSMSAVVLSCGGVGYYASARQCGGGPASVGKEATLYTVMSVTENDVSLYALPPRSSRPALRCSPPCPALAPRWGWPS